MRKEDVERVKKLLSEILSLERFIDAASTFHDCEIELRCGPGNFLAKDHIKEDILNTMEAKKIFLEKKLEEI